MHIFKIGTRGSELALAQTKSAIKALKQLNINAQSEIIKTTGDIDMRPFTSISGDGFFTKEIEASLLTQQIDLAVHSAKDLPSMTHLKIPWSAFSNREDFKDILITKKNIKTKKLKIGTSSPRRIAQLKKLNPHALTVSLRGNVPSRINKVLSNQYDGIILAKAGLSRLNLFKQIKKNSELEVKELDWVTSPNQGILAIQYKKDLFDEIKKVFNPELTQIALAEKSILSFLGGGCHLPLGVNIQKNSLYELTLFLEQQKDDPIEFDISDKNLSILLQKTFLKLLNFQNTSLRKIWITNPLEHQQKVFQKLSNKEFTPMSWPLVEIKPTWKIDAIDTFNQTLRDQKPIIAFTSQFGAQIFLKQLTYQNLNEFNNCQIYCIGKSTQDFLKDHLISNTVLPSKATAKNLAEHILTNNSVGGVIVPGTKDSKLLKYFKDSALECSVLELYETKPSSLPISKATPKFKNGDWLTFSSPSAIKALVLRHDFKEIFETIKKQNVKILALGPTTAQALKENNLNPSIVSEAGSWSDAINKIKKDLKK